MPTKYALQQKTLPSISKQGAKIQDETDDVVLEVDDPSIFRQKPYAGMSPEDLDRFSNTPFWNTFRRISMAIFFLLWFSLFLISIILIVVYPRCKPISKQKWWQHTNFYQIYVPSFQDSNQDGIGDIRGLESRLPDLQFMGIETLVLSPIFEQKGVSIERFSEDLVTDFQRSDARIGNESDLQSLVATAHKKGMRLVLEFPINHVGRNHTWFQHSLNNTGNWSNFFVWSSSNNPPNNWKSRTGKSAWSCATRRSACFYHSGNEDQPDLNWRSAIVREKMNNAIKFWLTKGFDGVSLSQATDLVEDFDLRDEPSNSSRAFTRDLPETIDSIKRLRATVHAQNASAVVMATLDSNLDTLDRYVSFHGAVVVDVPINRRPLLALEDEKCGAECIWKVIEKLDSKTTRPQWPSFLLGDRNTKERLKMPNAFPKTALLLFSILPGNLATFFGDEVGLNRTLSPMRWTNASNGGFTESSVTPWKPVELPLDANFIEEKTQANSGVRLMKSIQEIRKMNPALRYGQLHLVLAKGSVLALRRELDGQRSFLVVVNFGSKEAGAAEIGLAGRPGIPQEMDLVIDTLVGKSSEEAAAVKPSEVSLKPGQGLLFRWNYVIKEHL